MTFPEKQNPRHIAIVMDGNGRWAQQRSQLRVVGHQEGVESVRAVIRYCAQAGIEVLSLFAFSSENWARPAAEVKALMLLFAKALKNEIKQLHQSNIRLRIAGDRSRFSKNLKQLMSDGEKLTANNTGLTLLIAVNYGGQWELVQAAKNIALDVQNGALNPQQITEEKFPEYLTTHDLPDIDLFIRTSGEKRISNFFLWQLAYSELYFTDTLWPDFREAQLRDAIDEFQQRRRRFGLTAEQLEQTNNA